MTQMEWGIIIAYLGGMIGLSVYLGRRQASQEDYYLGGRKLPWWAVGISTMATQTSAISFISIPAFVALRPGGGVNWLQYELGVPLAVIITMVFLVPFFRRLQLVSVYEYLELRYSPGVRRLVSLIFLISRGLGTGVGVYASAIALSVCAGTSLEATILVIGGVTIIYDTIGGMRAVVYSDVIQMAILALGIGVCLYYAADLAGGAAAVWEGFPSGRSVALDPSLGLDGASAVPFWAYLVGGIFLYCSYYGTDQSQVQRELSARSETQTRLSLILNGLARFPLSLLYVALGMALWAVLDSSPGLAARIPPGRPDYLVPQFILHYLPPGVRALLFAALMAAAMSSLDSALNSLSAATVRDFLNIRDYGPRRAMLLGKLATVAWGLAITGFAFAAESISATVIEAINKIGSAFYGPILAAFIGGIMSRRIGPAGITAGLAAGVGLNLWLWVFQPGVHWMWWNAAGFLTALATAWGIGVLRGRTWPGIAPYTLGAFNLLSQERKWFWAYALLVIYFVFMLLVLHFW